MYPALGQCANNISGLCRAIPGKTQARNPAFARIWMLLWLLWGPYRHYQLWVCFSSKQGQDVRAHNKTITNQMQQISESVFPLPSSSTPNACRSPMLVPEALLSCIGDQHQPHLMAERGRVAHLVSSQGTARKKHKAMCCNTEVLVS